MTDWTRASAELRAGWLSSRSTRKELGYQANPAACGARKAMGTFAGASARERVRMSRAAPPRPWRRMTTPLACSSWAPAR